MSVIYYDEHSNAFLLGIGDNLYQCINNYTKLLVKCGAAPETTEGEEEEEKEKGKKLRAEGPAYITGIATCGELLAVISNNKVVETFDRKFQKCGSTVAIKRPTSVQITDQHVIISDKSGDAYSYNMQLANRKYLLGHVSVVMDMKITPDKQFLITCDRDEKIRISHFPNCYNIESYLLGHEEYVLKILLLSPSILLSVGGDRKLLLWDLTSHTLLQTLASTHGDYTSVTYTSPYLITCNSSHVSVYKLSDNTLTLTSELTSEHDIVSLAASSTHVVALTRGPKLVSYEFNEGVLGGKCEIEGDVDLSKSVDSALPEKKKVVRTAGFTEYFERKRKRIEEENLKEETRKIALTT